MSPAHSQHQKLVPITRDLLREFYKDYPLDPVPSEWVEQVQNCKEVVAAVERPGSKVQALVELEVPKRIDDCNWRSRLYCEEAALYLDTVASCTNLGEQEVKALKASAARLKATADRVEAVQQSNTESAAAQIRKFLPQDFRASLLEVKRNAQERSNKKAVDDLLKKGGTIRDRYELYLKQQWERREALVQMGNLTGVFKMMVKVIGGVPQVLLDFAKEINAPLGPMEEQRLKYGPDFYKICEVGNALNVAAAVWAEAAPSCTLEANTQAWSLLRPAADFYCDELARIVNFLGALFVKSPFFITQDQAQKAAEHAATERASMDGKRASAAGNAPAEHPRHHGNTYHDDDVDSWHSGEEEPRHSGLACAPILSMLESKVFPHSHSHQHHHHHHRDGHLSSHGSLRTSMSRSARETASQHQVIINEMGGKGLPAVGSTTSANSNIGMIPVGKSPGISSTGTASDVSPELPEPAQVTPQMNSVARAADTRAAHSLPPKPPANPSAVQQQQQRSEQVPGVQQQQLSASQAHVAQQGISISFLSQDSGKDMSGASGPLAPTESNMTAASAFYAARDAGAGYSSSGQVHVLSPAATGGALTALHTNASATSADFMSCCDNMSWVSGSLQYQSSVYDDEEGRQSQSHVSYPQYPPGLLNSPSGKASLTRHLPSGSGANRSGSSPAIPQLQPSQNLGSSTGSSSTVTGGAAAATSQAKETRPMPTIVSEGGSDHQHKLGAANGVKGGAVNADGTHVATAGVNLQAERVQQVPADAASGAGQGRQGSDDWRFSCFSCFRPAVK